MKYVISSFLVLFGLCGIASAQPMMMDPSKMSGIPRPDPQVPPGTITVRLIRGALDKRMVGTDVTLATADGAGKAQSQKTDAEGRATFSGLGAGPYTASAKDGETSLSSQPMQLEPQMGTRVMLVFPMTGAGAPDGSAHVDTTLPPGTLIVRAEDGTGQALSGLDVILGHARAGEQQVVELHAKTDTAGEAKFEGLDRKPTSGYVAEIMSSGARFAGKPFKMADNAGSRVVLVVRQVSSDTSTLSIAEGSHFLVEVTDDALQIIEVLRIHNAGTAAFDAGPDGLHIPLPHAAVQIQAPDNDPNVAISGHDVVYRAPLPPGDTPFRAAYLLPYHGESVALSQPTPIAFSRLAVVTQRLEEMRVSGHNLQGEERDMQGHKLMVYFGDGTTRGGEIHIQFDNLPHTSAMPRYVAAVVCIALVLVFGIYAASGGGDRRARLEVERRRIFDQLVAFDAEPNGSPADRQRIVARLSDIYRGLDELGGG
ncbi:MAG: Ig-like domain-containing protein [Polyangia bacterium]